MTRPVLAFAASLLAASSLADPAFAHTGHGVAFTAVHGFLHPLTGLDHLAAMLVVGLAALKLSPQRVWLPPALFLVGLAGGAVMQLSGLAIPFYEAGILLSLVALGALVASGKAAPMAAVGPALVMFGLVHGAAHAAEAPSASFAAYMAGFVLASALLHGLGLAFAGFVQSRGMTIATRLSGGAVATLGLALAVAGG